MQHDNRVPELPLWCTLYFVNSHMEARTFESLIFESVPQGFSCHTIIAGKYSKRCVSIVTDVLSMEHHQPPKIVDLHNIDDNPEQSMETLFTSGLLWGKRVLVLADFTQNVPQRAAVAILNMDWRVRENRISRWEVSDLNIFSSCSLMEVCVHETRIKRFAVPSFVTMQTRMFAGACVCKRLSCVLMTMGDLEEYDATDDPPVLTDESKDRLRQLATLAATNGVPVDAFCGPRTVLVDSSAAGKATVEFLLGNTDWSFVPVYLAMDSPFKVNRQLLNAPLGQHFVIIALRHQVETVLSFMQNTDAIASVQPKQHRQRTVVNPYSLYDILYVKVTDDTISAKVDAAPITDEKQMDAVYGTAMTAILRCPRLRRVITARGHDKPVTEDVNARGAHEYGAPGRGRAAAAAAESDYASAGRRKSLIANFSLQDEVAKLRKKE